MRHLGHSSLCIVHRALCIASIALAALGAANAGFVEYVQVTLSKPAKSKLPLSTGWNFTTTSRLWVDCALTSTEDTMKQYRFVQSSDGYAAAYVNGNKQYAFNCSDDGVWQTTSKPISTTRYVTEIDNARNLWTMTDAVSGDYFTSDAVTAGKKDYTKNGVVYLGANNVATVGGCIYYGFKGWDGDEQKVELIPCEVDGQAGFLDLVTGLYRFPTAIAGYTWTAGPAATPADGKLYVGGAPAAIGSPTPAYGVSSVSNGTSVTCTAPASANLAGTNYLCTGYTLISYDFDTGLPTTNTAASTSLTYTPSGYARLIWNWQTNGDASMHVAASSADSSLGTVSGTAAGDFAYGDAFTCTATPASGCRFSHWSGLPAGVDPRAATVSFAVGNVDLDIAAHFISTPNTVIYVKADATGAANGSSWSDAYPKISPAIAAAANGDTIYVAKGVYVEKLTLPKSLTLYGGFPGLSMAETPADRDPETYQTVVTPSTAAQTSAVWQHVEPDMDNYTFTTANTTTKLIAADGTVNLPAFTGDYDSWASSAPVSATMLTVDGAYTNRIDGLWIVNGTQWLLNGGDAVTTVANCNFIAGGGGGSIQGYNASNAIGKYLCLTNCLFFGAKMKAGRGGFLLTKGGDFAIDDCRIAGFVNNGVEAYGGCVVYYWSGTKNFLWRNCTLTHAIIWNNSTYNSNTANACFGHEQKALDCLYENFAVTNNVLMSTGGTWCYPFFSSSTGQYFKNLDFSRNTFVIKPTYTSAINHYMMFSRQALNIENATFADNMVYVPQTATSEGPFYAGITTMNASTYRPMVNCIFRNNSIVMKDTIGMTPTFGQILVSGSAAQLGLANCVFSHTDTGTYDIALPTATAQPHTVVNCLFERNGGEDQYQPFLLDAGATLNLVNSSVAGMRAEDFRTAGTINFQNSDATPFALAGERVAGYANPVLRPAALSPSMRDSRPVAVDSWNTVTVWGHVYTNAGTSFSYKSDETTWTALMPKQGATQRGRYGLVTDAVGARRTEASFTRGAVQDPAPGTENAPTLTILKDPWAGGTVSPALSVAADAGTGATPAVTATPAFDGTTVTWYEADGMTVLASGATLPSQTLAASKTVIATFASPEVTVTFDLDGAGTFANGTDQCVLTASAGAVLEIPPFTLDNAVAEEWLPHAPPATIAASNAVFTLKWVSTDVRVFRVKPDGTGDGSSWQNAAGDLAAVIADAGRYRGEVWFKKGTYPLGEPLHIMANVGLYGGFNGTETSRDEASGTPDETVLTGAREGGVASRAFVTDNIGTNFTVQGFTLTSFATVVSQSTQQHGMLFKDCVFTGTTDTAANVYSRTTFDSCLFTGVPHAAYFNEATPEGSVFTNCVFRNNTTPTDSWLLGFGSTGSPNVYFRNCDFIGNTVPGTGDGGRLILTQLKLTITDCNFSGNSAYYLIWQDCGGSQMRMYRTKFTNNVFNYLFRNRDGGYNVFRDCYIADNNKGGTKRGTLFTFVSNSTAWQLIQNTVMRDNTTSAALIETRLNQIVNCFILDTVFTGTEKADMKSIHNNGYGVNILNTVFRNSAEGYVAVKNGLGTELKARYASVVMSGEPDPAVTVDWSSDLVTGVYAKVRKPVLTKGNVASMQLSGSSPYAKAGKLPYVDSSLNVFFYDDTASAWRKLTASGTSSKTATAEAAKDAFGDPWSEEGVALGPLNFMPVSGTYLFLR